MNKKIENIVYKGCGKRFNWGQGVSGDGFRVRICGSGNKSPVFCEDCIKRQRGDNTQLNSKEVKQNDRTNS